MDLTLGTSPLLLVLCLLAAAGLTWWTYGRSVPRVPTARRLLLSALRGAALFIVLILLFEPVLRRIEATEEPPVLAVLVDGSQSLGREDGEGGAAAARDALRRLPDLDGAEARLYTFDAEAAPLDGPADSLRFEGVRTDIAGALQRIERDLDAQNLGGVLLISDGRYNTGRNPIYLAERYDVPIYTTVVGDTARQRDVLVARVTTNEIAYAGV